MSAAVRTAIGLDLGGTSVKAVAVSAEGQELCRETQPYDLQVGGAFADATRELLERLERRLGVTSDVGVSAPGIPAANGRSIAFMPDRFPGLVDLEWSRHLGRERVPVLNDAQAALLGEVWLGAAKGASDVLLLTLGTGVGGAAMVGGKLLRGHTGKAGHLGHVSLDPDGCLDITHTPGSLEDAIGNHSVTRRSAGRFASTLELIRAHESGDSQATGVWLTSVKALAAAIASFTNILDPEVVILGGGIAGGGESLFAPLRAMVDQFEWKVLGHEVRIIPARLGEFAGAYGAAHRALTPASH